MTDFVTSQFRNPCGVFWRGTWKRLASEGAVEPTGPVGKPVDAGEFYGIAITHDPEAAEDVITYFWNRRHE